MQKLQLLLNFYWIYQDCIKSKGIIGETTNNIHTNYSNSYIVAILKDCHDGFKLQLHHEVLFSSKEQTMYMTIEKR